MTSTPFDPDLEVYSLTSEQVLAVEELFAAALAEAGYPARVDPGTGDAWCACPDDVWVNACNVARVYLGLPQFPDVATWRRWCDNLKARPG